MSIVSNWKTDIRHRIYDNQWFVVGCYEDESDAYDRANDAWTDRYAEIKLRFDLGDYEDYFCWHATLPVWFLHQDGLWSKFLFNYLSDETGLYNSESEAIEAVALVSLIPERFEGYQEHLAAVLPPFEGRYDEVSLEWTREGF